MVLLLSDRDIAMDRDQLSRYLRDRIPLAGAMEVSALEVASDRVRLGVPLEPNRNHRGTGFGGSVATLATLAAWSLVRVRLGGSGKRVHLVIQLQEMQFTRPVMYDFSAVARLGEGQDWERFKVQLEGHGKARIRVVADVECAGETCAMFAGDFAALARQAGAAFSGTRSGNGADADG